jgi:hypothetical protein
VKIHILSDRRFPFISSPLAAVPLLPRSGFVQSAYGFANSAAWLDVLFDSSHPNVMSQKWKVHPIKPPNLSHARSSAG